MSTSTEVFVDEHLPSLVAGRESLDALFTSYHPIEEDLAETQDPSLRITLQSGDLWYSLETVFAAAMMPDVGFAAMQEEAQRAIREGIVVQRPEQRSALASLERPLVVAYLGFSGFQSMLNIIKELRQDLPNATIVTMTCHCDLNSKEEELEPLLKQQVINFSLRTECAGTTSMNRLIKCLKLAWMSRGRD